MSFSDHKITQFTHRISELADQPNMPADELKARFDSSPEELRAAHNAVCDDAARLEARDEGIVVDTFGDTIDKSMLSTELADELDAKATQTALAEVSADVTAEAAARAGGDSALSSRVSSLESSVPQKARVYYTSYTGNSGSRSFSLSFSPKLVILASDDYSVCTPKAPMAVAQGKTVSYSGVTLASLSGKTLSVSADSGYNNSGVSYAVLAIT